MILCDRAPTIPKTTFSIENEMELKVEESLMMPAVFHTVASRTQLAVVTIPLTFTFRPLAVHIHIHTHRLNRPQLKNDSN